MILSREPHLLLDLQGVLSPPELGVTYGALRPVFFLAVLAGLIAVSMYVLMLPSLEARQLTWEGRDVRSQELAI